MDSLALVTQLAGLGTRVNTQVLLVPKPASSQQIMGMRGPECSGGVEVVVPIAELFARKGIFWPRAASFPAVSQRAIREVKKPREGPGWCGS